MQPTVIMLYEARVFLTTPSRYTAVDCVWNVMAHAQKPDFVLRRNGRVHLNRRGRQFNRLLAAEVCASTVVMLDTPCSEVVWRVLATHSISHFPLHFHSRATPCAITFQLESNRSSPSLIINLDTKWTQVVNFAPRQLHPREKNPGTQYTGDCACSRAGLDGFGEGKITCPCRHSNPGLSRP